jgi:hypothetical protein
MIAKSYELVGADLERARVSREPLHRYYVRFCQRAMDMADASCPAKGIVPKRVGDDLYVQYLDRRLRFSFAFDRQADRGILCVDDMSVVGLYDGREPVRVETISFDDVGKSDVVDSDGVKLSLSDCAQSLQLALGLVDLAIDQNPWKVS